MDRIALLNTLELGLFILIGSLISIYFKKNKSFGMVWNYSNNIESLWGQLKRYTNNFSGISIENLNNKFNNK